MGILGNLEKPPDGLTYREHQILLSGEVKIDQDA